MATFEQLTKAHDLWQRASVQLKSSVFVNNYDKTIYWGAIEARLKSYYISKLKQHLKHIETSRN